MPDFLFVISFFLFPWIFYFIHKAADERLLKISIVNVVFVSLMLFSYFGIFPLYFGLDEFNNYLKVDNKQIVFKMFVISSLNILFLLIGVLITRFIFKIKKRRNFSGPESINRTQYMLILCLIILSVVTLSRYILKIDEIAIFTLFENGHAAANIARSKMGNDFPGRYHWYAVFIHQLSYFSSFILLASYLIKREKTVLILFFISFSIATFASIMAIEKGPVVIYFLSLCAVWFLVKKDGRVPLKFTIFMLLGVFFLLAVFGVYFAGAEGLFSGFTAVFSRAFASSISPAYFYLLIFPEYIGFMYGKTISNPGGIFPYEPFRYTIEVMNWVVPGLKERGIVGSMPTVFWGEIYVNFNWYVIPLFSFITGIFLALIDWLITKLKYNAITIAFNVWLILFFKNLAITGFSGFVFSVDFYIVGIAFIVICYFNSENNKADFYQNSTADSSDAKKSYTSITK
ncbi:oligosaccharide repeat unit polymerase [Alcaligenaceae bacterium]|nr:oligosaccharide repeat unit polymerase [Alcaligenaceae bacterium]